MATKQPLPDFASDDDERASWDAHMHDVDDYFEDEPVDMMWDLRPETKEPFTPRLQPSVVRRLKYVGGRVGMPYQTFTRWLILPGLREAMAELKARNRPAVTAGEEDR